MVVTTVAMPPDLHEQLAIAAVKERAAMTELIRQAVKEWLERREKKQQRRGGDSPHLDSP